MSFSALIFVYFYHCIMANSDVIVAVNTDPKAPIFGAAHYAATCDLFDLIEAMLSRLRSGKPA